MSTTLNSPQVMYISHYAALILRITEVPLFSYLVHNWSVIVFVQWNIGSVAPGICPQMPQPEKQV